LIKEEILRDSIILKIYNLNIVHFKKKPIFNIKT